jgi:hypothetical protein
MPFRCAVHAAVLTLAIVALPVNGGTIYSSDFESPVGSEWSTSATTTTPGGCTRCTTFLGRFSGDTVELALTGLPGHSELTVSFYLYLIGSWDGNRDDYAGPDHWSFGISGDTPLLTTTFSTYGPAQAFPDSYPGGDHPWGTGSLEQNTLGYPTDTWDNDFVYHLSYTIPHSSGSVSFSFSGWNLQGVADESWGLDDVVVAGDASDVPEPACLALLALPLSMLLLVRRIRG